MQYILLICLFILSACGGGGGDGQNANTSAVGNHTAVTISLGDKVAAGAIGQEGQVPNTVQSMSVTVYSSTGVAIAGPVIANTPTLSVTIDVPNGIGIRFMILSFDTQGATLPEKSRRLYAGVEALKLSYGTMLLFLNRQFQNLPKLFRARS